MKLDQKESALGGFSARHMIAVLSGTMLMRVVFGLYGIATRRIAHALCLFGSIWYRYAKHVPVLTLSLKG